MTDRTRLVIGRSMAGVGLTSAVLGVGWLIALGNSSDLWEYWIVHNALVAIVGGVIVWMVVPGQPRNGTIWILAWSGLFTGLLVVGSAILTQAIETLDLGIGLFDLVPADLPTWLALIAMQVNWLWIGVFLALGVLYLFPDGETRSALFRVLFRGFLLVVGLTALGLFWEARPSSMFTLADSQDLNAGFRSPTAVMLTLGYPLTFLFVALGAVSFVMRYRQSRGEERQQFRWVALGASVTGVTIASAFVVDELVGRLDVALYLGAIGFVALLGSVGIAIGKYRIYDLDAVISRTLVYGLLALFITAVYVGIAVVPWVVLGSEADNNTWLGILATVVVAVSFQPLRRWLQRFANRVVFGRQATPYEVLSSFSKGISAVDPEVLTEIAKSLTEGTTAESVSIWVGDGADSHRIASWPVASSAGSLATETATVHHDGEALGKVVLDVPAGQPFPVTDRNLLEQVAAGLGLALRNLQLTDDLSTRVDELRESRRRVVALQDQTRRLLERDLHDGAQQRLVALKIKIGLASTMATKGDFEDVSRILDEVKNETDLTIDSLRNLARGIYPPLLESEGLGAALTAQLRRAHVPVTVQTAGIGRYTEEIEATFYFCVLEAVQNAVKHARAQSVLVTVREEGGRLVFEVRDDGVGFDAEAAHTGQGLVNMADRLDAIEGAIRVESSPGSGTRVAGSAPVRQLVVS